MAVQIQQLGKQFYRGLYSKGLSIGIVSTFLLFSADSLHSAQWHENSYDEFGIVVAGLEHIAELSQKEGDPLPLSPFSENKSPADYQRNPSSVSRKVLKFLSRYLRLSHLALMVRME